MLRFVCFAIVMAAALTSWTSSGIAEAAFFIEERNGGWRGGDVRMACRYADRLYEAAIVGGQPHVSIDGEPQTFFKASMAPYGFAVSRTVDGVFTMLMFAFPRRELSVIELPEADIFSGAGMTPVTVGCA